MGIDDYNYEPHIAKCIEDICHYSLKIAKTGEREFRLSWNYNGDISIRSDLTIASVQVSLLDRRWRYLQGRVLDALEGSFFFQAEEWL